MVQLSNRFKVNDKDVTANVIDGEAIIINLANSMYYSLDKTGALAWVLIGGGQSVDESAEILSTRFSAPLDRVRGDLHKLVNDLLAQKLILPVDGSAKSPKILLDPPTGEPYETPVLNSYDDMEDVLALDPPLPQIAIENEAWETSK